jgi:phage recombination protein Bet
MTTPIQNQQAPQTTTREKSRSDFERLLEQDVKTQVWFEPYGSNDEIKLSVPLIKRYIATPAKDKESGNEIQPSDEECVKFLMLCKARRLNPFEGDAFMVPFWDGRLRRHAWSLITAHSAFLKRAELHPNFDGMESGVIVQDKEGNLVERKGDFRLDSDRLLGGWAIVHVKNHNFPTVRRVRLATYKKEFGVWMQDPEGMICKVAEAAACRDSFPTQIGGMFLREEMEGGNEAPQSEVKRPKFDGMPEPDRTTQPVNAVHDPTQIDKTKRPKRPTMVEEPLEAPKPTPQPETPPVAQPAPNPAPVASPPAAETPDKTILRLATEAGISKEQLVAYMKADRWMKPTQSQVSEVSTIKLDAFLNVWQAEPARMIEKIRSVK